VTCFDPVVRFRVDMSRERISELNLPPHFTNIQHALQMAPPSAGCQDTPNRQIILITDGLPTAHFEGAVAVHAVPARSLTEEATMREGALCRPRRHHDQSVPGAQLVAIAKRISSSPTG
jgi:uncharacterized protein with von Willebrand factor type A (vWA) domain